MGLSGGRRSLCCLNLVQEGGHVECLWHSWTVIPKELVNHLRVGEGVEGGGRWKREVRRVKGREEEREEGMEEQSREDGGMKVGRER